MPYINNTGLPSVTDILKRYINVDWFTQEAAERGTAVHEACHAHLTGGHSAPLPPDWQSYFISFQKWCELARPQVEVAEQRLIDPGFLYCGQPDFIGKTIFREGRGLIDYKTSILFERWHRLQGAAYRRLAEVSSLETQWGAILRLRQNGTPAIMDYLPDNYLMDFNRFLMVLSLYDFFK